MKITENNEKLGLKRNNNRTAIELMVFNQKVSSQLLSVLSLIERIKKTIILFIFFEFK